MNPGSSNHLYAQYIASQLDRMVSSNRSLEGMWIPLAQVISDTRWAMVQEHLLHLGWISEAYTGPEDLTSPLLGVRYVRLISKSLPTETRTRWR